MPPANDRVSSGDPVKGADIRGNLAQITLGSVDVGAFGQEIVHHEFRAGRGREKTRGHAAETDDGRTRKHEHQEDGKHAQVNCPAQQPAITAQEHILAGGFDQAGLQQQRTKIRRQPNGDQPGKHQRDGNRVKQASGVFTRGIRRKPDLRKGQKANHGPAQQRPFGPVHHRHCRLSRILAFLDPHQGALDNDNCIVHQHPQGDDQRPKRDTLHIQTVKIHAKQGARDGDQQDAPLEKTGPQAHEHQQRATTIASASATFITKSDTEALTLED